MSLLGFLLTTIQVDLEPAAGTYLPLQEAGYYYTYMKNRMRWLILWQNW